MFADLFIYSEGRVPTEAHKWRLHYETDSESVVNTQESESEVDSAGNQAGWSKMNEMQGRQGNAAAADSEP
jgi:hypothetical protein